MSSLKRYTGSKSHENDKKKKSGASKCFDCQKGTLYAISYSEDLLLLLFF